jgi:PAS domain S-box-containing protein
MQPFLNGGGSAELIQLIEDSIPMGLFSMDMKTRDMRWSPGMFRLLGLDPSTHQPTPGMFEAVIHPRDRTTLAAVQLAMRSGMPLHHDLQVINAMGRPRWVRAKADFLLDGSGKPSRMIGSLLDVSLEHDAKLFARAIQRRLDAVISVCSPIWWIAGAEGRVERIEGWEELTGQTQEQSRDGGWRNMVHADDIDRVLRERTRAIEAGEDYRIEMRVALRQGGFRWMAARGTPARDENGEIAEWIGSLTDIHPSKEWPVSQIEIERLSGAQVRAARAIVNWSVKQLSEASGVPVSAIRRMEEFDGAVRAFSGASNKIRSALEHAGVDFIVPPVGKPAVRPA